MLICKPFSLTWPLAQAAHVQIVACLATWTNIFSLLRIVQPHMIRCRYHGIEEGCNWRPTVAATLNKRSHYSTPLFCPPDRIRPTVPCIDPRIAAPPTHTTTTPTHGPPGLEALRTHVGVDPHATTRRAVTRTAAATATTTPRTTANGTTTPVTFATCGTIPHGTGVMGGTIRTTPAGTTRTTRRGAGKTATARRATVARWRRGRCRGEV